MRTVLTLSNYRKDPDIVKWIPGLITLTSVKDIHRLGKDSTLRVLPKDLFRRLAVMLNWVSAFDVAKRGKYFPPVRLLEDGVEAVEEDDDEEEEEEDDEEDDSDDSDD